MDTKVASEDLFQIAQLIDQLRHEDNLLRVNAAKSLVKIGILYCIIHDEI